MNIKIAKTMLILCVVYMIGFYILKFIFPDLLLLTIVDQNILTFGKFLESHIAILEIYYCITGFITFYLFICASRGSFRLNWKELIYLLCAVAINELITWFLPELMVHTSASLMLLLAWLCKGKLSYTTISFVIHGYLSQFLFSIRGFETVITQINTASGFILTIEGYVWMIILGLLFYLKEKKHGTHITTISQQDGR